MVRVCGAPRGQCQGRTVTTNCRARPPGKRNERRPGQRAGAIGFQSDLRLTLPVHGTRRSGRAGLRHGHPQRRPGKAEFARTGALQSGGRPPQPRLTHAEPPELLRHRQTAVPRPATTPAASRAPSTPVPCVRTSATVTDTRSSLPDPGPLGRAPRTASFAGLHLLVRCRRDLHTSSFPLEIFPPK